MTHAIVPGPGDSAKPAMSASKALKLAWLSWGVVLASPFVALQLLVTFENWRGRLTMQLINTHDLGRLDWNPVVWLAAVVAYLLIVVAGSFLWRGHVMRDYWLGRPVAPGKYVLATICIGIALALAGILSVVGSLFTGSFLPNLIPGIVALILFVTHWPRGGAIVHEVKETKVGQS